MMIKFDCYEYVFSRSKLNGLLYKSCDPNRSHADEHNN